MEDSMRYWSLSPYKSLGLDGIKLAELIEGQDFLMQLAP